MENDDDSLLDRIVTRLRTEAVPEMPEELATGRGVTDRAWVWYGVAVSAVAASIIALTLWGARWHEDKVLRDVAKGPHAKTESAVVVKNVDLATPIERLKSELVALDDEIRELQSKAMLLDARRKADELLAKF